MTSVTISETRHAKLYIGEIENRYLTGEATESPM